jgi:very-short-patch-repair endonuclease
LPFLVNEPVYRARGGWLAEPDLALDGAKIALEYQGIDHADPDRMRRDLTRFADLRGEGWLVLPYGPAEVFGRPWQIAAEVRAAVRARAPGLLR